MQSRHRQASRHFTVDEANATLPLVRAIVKDLTELACEVIQRRERLSSLPPHDHRGDCDPYAEEVAEIAEGLDRDRRRLREYVEELLELGVEPKSITLGVVDFPAILDGRPVYLCWKQGEAEVAYWHDRGATFLERRPLGQAGRSQGGRQSRLPEGDPTSDATSGH